jgi:hypothetical protein
MAVDEKAAVRFRILVDTDGENGQIGLVAVEFEERRQLHDARFAPTGPKIKHDDLAPVAGQMDGG